MKDLTKELFEEAILMSFKKGFMQGAKISMEAQMESRDGKDGIKIFDEKMKKAFADEIRNLKLVSSMADSLSRSLHNKKENPN